MIPDRPCDWSNRHAGPVRPSITTARDAFLTGFASLPGWARVALAIRNALLRPFGIKTEGEDGAELMTSLPVLRETPDHYVIGLDDKHLLFTLDVTLENRIAAVTTRIWFHHWFGRLYLMIVLIPHKLILRHAIRGLR